MSADEKRVTVWALSTEIEAFRRNLSARPAKDENDVRQQHMRLLRSALEAVRASK